MSKASPQVEMLSYGLYGPWNRKDIPKLIRFTSEIPVALGHEFGYVLRIIKAKGALLEFCIEHPNFRDDKGQKAAPFTGEQYVRSNNYHFFLGDTFWEPLHDKCGIWELSTRLDGREIARKVFKMVSDDGTH